MPAPEQEQELPQLTVFCFILSRPLLVETKTSTLDSTVI